MSGISPLIVQVFDHPVPKRHRVKRQKKTIRTRIGTRIRVSRDG